jgi:hypothetical protein
VQNSRGWPGHAGHNDELRLSRIAVKPTCKLPANNVLAGWAGRGRFRPWRCSLRDIAQATTNAEAMMRLAKAIALLALIGIGLTSLGGCVVHERRDGGVTVRPVH